MSSTTQSFIRFGLGAVLAGGFALPTQAQLITNGGFETGDFSSWTVPASPFVYVGTGIAHSGTFGVGFSRVGSQDFISQTLTTVVGDNYTLDFWLGNVVGPPNLFTVSWNGSILAALTQTNAAAFAYAHFTATGLVATSTSTTLTFGGRHDPASWRLGKR